MSIKMVDFVGFVFVRVESERLPLLAQGLKARFGNIKTVAFCLIPVFIALSLWSLLLNG